MSWYNDIKAKMYMHNNNQPCESTKYLHISEFVLKEIIPTQCYSDALGYSAFMGDKFVFFITTKGVFKICRKNIFSYTKDNNDCLELKINKHLWVYLNLEDIINLEYEAEEYTE